PGDVRYHDRGAARHRLDERDAERGTRCGAEVQVGAAVVLGALALHAAGEADGGAEPPGPPLVVAAPRAVTHDGEARPRMPFQDAGHRLEQRTEPVSRLEPREKQQAGPARARIRRPGDVWRGDFGERAGVDGVAEGGGEG